MRFAPIIIFVTFAVLGFPGRGMAQATETSTNGLTLLLAKVRVDLKSGKRTEAALADDLRKFDDLLDAENGKRTELAANIILSKGILYSEVFDDPERAKIFFLEIKRNYSNTMIAGKLDPLLAMMDAQAESKASIPALSPGVTFPDFNVIDAKGNPLSVSLLKGKVVLLEFWATWNGPSLTVLPVSIALYTKYHDQGFEIIGVNLDEDKNKFLSYIKDNKMVWPEYSDGQRWENKLVRKYRLAAIPANILIDASGKIIARDINGDELAQAVAKALGK